MLRRLADVVQPLIRRFTADETDEKMGGSTDWGRRWCHGGGEREEKRRQETRRDERR